MNFVIYKRLLMAYPPRMAPNSTYTFEVSEDRFPVRLDQFLAGQFPAYSRSFIQKIIADGCVAINGTQIVKSSFQLKKHDTIVMRLPSENPVTIVPSLDLQPLVQIVFEHEHFLILNKPAGLMMHKPNVHSTEFTLVDWLLAHDHEIKNVGSIDRPGIVHRLDKDTSGIIIVARTNLAHAIFTKLFEQRLINKIYLAVVSGNPKEREGTIDFPIGRAINYRARMTAFSGHVPLITKTRHATTNYRVLEYFEDTALVEFKPTTGRTHQIRVHSAALGHPLIGDALYGNDSSLITRHALHAHSILFIFQNKSYVFTADLPEDLQKLLSNMRPIKD